MNHPFAVEVFERFLKGESIRQLADELQIPADRVELRLRAAALYLEHQAKYGPIELPSRYRDRYGHCQ
jgi:DNA-directed RNA polymerase specialized sigma24 family protein